MDIVRLLNDYNVSFATEGEKHTAPGWVNMNCCFCTGTSGLHLGFNLENEYFTCYRCGWHSPVKTIAAILDVSLPDAAIILQRYGNMPFTANKAVKRAEKPLILPSNTVALTNNHKTYLTKRGYDADVLEKKWGLLSTGVLSQIERIPYKHRILIPYVWNGQMATFDTRDVTGKAEDKYKACPKDREILHRKSILYGNQEAWQSTGICVEGPADVWRFGDQAFATSGIGFTPEQVRLIAKIFKKVFIVFDYEPQAQRQARKLYVELSFRGVKTEVIPLKFGDPGEMVQRKANKFVKNLLL